MLINCSAMRQALIHTHKVASMVSITRSLKRRLEILKQDPEAFL